MHETAGRSAEEIVRAAWSVVYAEKFQYMPKPWRVQILIGDGERHVYRYETFDEDTEAAVWEAALAFTQEKQREIAEIEEEIKTQHEEIDECGFILCSETRCGDFPEAIWFASMVHRIHVINRTIDRLQAILADKRRGHEDGEYV